MKNSVSVVMYHYVRDLNNSRYPKIKGLLTSEFIGQLDYIQRFYNVISVSELINAIYSNNKLPKNALLLTFDDGFIDHFTTVFPILTERNLQGCFFPSAKPILHNEVLDVHKIHFILASDANTLEIISDIYYLLDKCHNKYNLRTNEQYFKKLAKKNRFDTKEIVFIKRLLQTELPEELRKIIASELFEKYVSSNEISFANELYMSVDQLKCMNRNGMHVGIHGYDHYWLGDMDSDIQEKEIDLSLDFLKMVGSNIDSWVMCYPYGSYNDSLIRLLKKKGCKLAFTTDVDIVSLDRDDALKLPRLDTNDLPKRSDTKANEWTSKQIK